MDGDGKNQSKAKPQAQPNEGRLDTAGKKRQSKAELKSAAPDKAHYDKTRHPGKGEIDDQENYRQGRQGPK